MAETLNLVDFERATVARLGELAMAAILNLTGFEQTEATRLKSDGTGRATARLRFDGFERAAAGLCGDFEHVTAGLYSNGRARGRLMRETWRLRACVGDLWVD
jgi:hypothetical protein